ncbi:MAG: hypothetical protein P3C10_09400 [Gemmatimonadota bacterium]|nr:hypothetical protein [Gemmatimonadota bacterium]
MGTRLAFDAARGRLWVVCRGCDRWNLSPLEERWEAIEAMERRFRDSRLRVSTDNVGLARLKEGVDLIRIGEPQRPEMAAWRYGDQFGRRRNRQLLVTGAVVGSAAALIGAVTALGASAASFAGVYANGAIWDAIVHGRQGESIGKIALPDGQVVDVQRKHARMSTLERGVEGSPLQLRLESVVGTHLLCGEAAMKAAARLLPTVNRFGGSRAQVQDAVSLLEEIGDPYRVLTSVQQRVGASAGDDRWGAGKKDFSGSNKRNMVKKLPGTLHSLAPRDRLALEMALHEESERRAMDGELAALALAWADAEQIAKIADDMFLPASIDEQLDTLRDR